MKSSAFTQLKSYSYGIQNDVARLKQSITQDADASKVFSGITNSDEDFVSSLLQNVEKIQGDFNKLENTVFEPIEKRLSHVTMEEHNTRLSNLLLLNEKLMNSLSQSLKSKKINLPDRLKIKSDTVVVNDENIPPNSHKSPNNHKSINVTDNSSQEIFSEINSNDNENSLTEDDKYIIICSDDMYVDDMTKGDSNMELTIPNTVVESRLSCGEGAKTPVLEKLTDTTRQLFNHNNSIIQSNDSIMDSFDAISTRSDCVTPNSPGSLNLSINTLTMTQARMSRSMRSPHSRLSLSSDVSTPKTPAHITPFQQVMASNESILSDDNILPVPKSFEIEIKNEAMDQPISKQFVYDSDGEDEKSFQISPMKVAEVLNPTINNKTETMNIFIEKIAEIEWKTAPSFLQMQVCFHIILLFSLVI